MYRTSRTLTLSAALLLGSIVLAPAPVFATNVSVDQIVPLFHLPLGGDNFITTNYVVTAADGATTVNVKCFNNALQRIGAGVGHNIVLGARGEQSQQTPATLGVDDDDLFTGTGFCWLHGSTIKDFAVQFTVGVTSDLAIGGVKPGTSSLVFTGTGLAETSSGLGIIPYPSAPSVNFAVFINPTEADVDLTMKLFNSSGAQQGADLVRTLQAREFLVLPVPDAFGFSTKPGSVHVEADGNGYLGWLVSISGSTVLLTPIGLDKDDAEYLDPAEAP